MRRIMMVMLVGLGVVIGLGLGYLKWYPLDTGHAGAGADQALQSQSASKSSGVPVFTGEAGQSTSAFGELESEAISLLSNRRYAESLQKLLEADLLVSSEAEARQFSSLLEEAVRLRVDQLRSLGRLAEIDALYENLTLTMPERGEYFLLLGEHRINTNNAQAALPVLAQIENHHQLGGRARELIEAVTASAEQVPLAVAPLARSGDQFVVRVELDGRREARLLLDTGAAMTVINPGLLESLGYDLGVETGRFVTAGGTVEAPVIRLDELVLAGQRIPGLRVGALNIESGGGTVDGLLGMDFLRRFRFHVDQDAGTLILEASRPDLLRDAR